MMDDISETDRIERGLAATRARMDHHLNELQDRLTPKQLLNDALSHFSGMAGGDFTSAFVTRTRTNPLPAALIGAGIAWLMATKNDGTWRGQPASRQMPQANLQARLSRAESRVQRFDHDDDNSYAERLDEARGNVIGVARNASDTAASYAQRIKDAVAAAAQSVRDKSHDLTASAGDALGRLGDNASDAGASFQEGTNTMANSAQGALSSITSNPFALGGIAALVGIVAGALLPTSNQEEAALGSAATKLRTAGRDLAQDVVDHGGHIVSDTLDAVKGSAETHGLTSDTPVGQLLADAKSGDLLGNVKQVAQETLQAGKDSAQTHLANNDDPQRG